MSDDRFDNTNGSRGLSDTDKGYYEDPSRSSDTMPEFLARRET